MMPTSEEGGDGVAARWTFRHPAPGSSRPSSPSQPSCYWPRLGLDKFTLINNAQFYFLGTFIKWVSNGIVRVNNRIVFIGFLWLLYFDKICDL